MHFPRLAVRASWLTCAVGWAWRWRLLSLRSRSARRSPTSACSATSARRSRPFGRSPASRSATRSRPTRWTPCANGSTRPGCSPTSTSGGRRHGAGVRINISVKDKFPWAPVPTGSWSANNKALRAAVRARQPVRARQAAPAGRAPGHRRLRAPSSLTATRRSSGAGSTGRSRRVVRARTSPSSIPTTRALGTGPTATPCSSRSPGRAHDRYRLVPPGQDPGRLADSKDYTDRQIVPAERSRADRDRGAGDEGGAHRFRSRPGQVRFSVA